MQAQDVMDNGLTQASIYHWEEYFHPPVEVAWHQIGAAELHFVLATVMLRNWTQSS
jgi:hypothetical protein